MYYMTNVVCIFDQVLLFIADLSILFILKVVIYLYDFLGIGRN